MGLTPINVYQIVQKGLLFSELTVLTCLQALAIHRVGILCSMSMHPEDVACNRGCSQGRFAHSQLANPR